MTRFIKILRYAKPYKRFAYLNIVFNFLYAIFSTLSFVALIPVLNVLFKETKPIYEKPIYGDAGIKIFLSDYLNYFTTKEVEAHGNIQVLVYAIGLIIAIFFLKNFFNYCALYFITRLRNGLLTGLRISLYEKILTLPISFFKERRKGDVMSRMGSDVIEIQQSYLSILELMIRDPLTIIATMSVMIFMSLKLTIFVLVFIPISGLFISRLGKSLKSNSAKLQAEQGHYLSIIEETLGGIKIVKGFDAERIFRNKFKISSLKFFKYSNKVINRYNLASPMSEFLGVLVIGIVLWQGGQIVLVDKLMEASSFIVYISLTYNILTPAKSISSSSYSIKKGNASADRILEILEADDSIKESPKAIVKTDFSDKIKLDKVSFSYEEKKIIKNFSLTIPKGSMVAIVGPSGGGKSTIVNLLTRFYDVDLGSIEIDGIDIRQLSKKSLKDLQGMVFQDSILFNDTVKNNLLIGKPNASLEEIIESAKIANAHDFIMQLSQQYDTNIGDAANKLSGGQKQRLSIARAVLKNPPIMILDEATSSLDTESEKLVQEALDNMMKNRTSIVIAHRLSTIQKADKIVVLDRGEIIETGTHKELISNTMLYKRLVDMQSI